MQSLLELEGKQLVLLRADVTGFSPDPVRYVAGFSKGEINQLAVLYLVEWASKQSSSCSAKVLLY